MVCALSASAQTSALPSWVKHLPKAPRKAMYYYRVTTAEARTYEQAYAKAFATAIQESRWKMGVVVDLNASEEQYANDILTNINVQSSQIRLQLNKACEHIATNSYNMNTRVYILWQVAKYGNVDPQFDEFTDCR
jgi:hypothetical protein